MKNTFISFQKIIDELQQQNCSAANQAAQCVNKYVHQIIKLQWMKLKNRFMIKRINSLLFHKSNICKI